ncbi:50S ribosomal protein L22 [Candidatus Omnitrophota bacterium]
MISRAIAKYIRISPRKFRQVIPLVKNRPVEQAIELLSAHNKKASMYATDLLLSALSNARIKEEGIDAGNLYISRFTADCGPTLKRFRAASMGRAVMIRKRTSHITVELDKINKSAHKRKDGGKGASAKKKAAEHKASSSKKRSHAAAANASAASKK